MIETIEEFGEIVNTFELARPNALPLLSTIKALRDVAREGKHLIDLLGIMEEQARGGHDASVDAVLDFNGLKLSLERLKGWEVE